MESNQHARLLHAFLEDACRRLARRRRLLPWRTWSLTTMGVPVALGLSLALSDCGGNTGEQESIYNGDCDGSDCAEQCGDGEDNNLDGRVDCDDPACSEDPSCVAVLYVAPVEVVCGDGVDNDDDGLTDCDDSDCLQEAAWLCQPVYGAPLQEDCADNLDNDGDGFTDCDDPDCEGMLGCSTADYGVPNWDWWETDCADGLDNDDDGLVDRADPDCVPPPPPLSSPEMDCADGLDNDDDGLIDRADPDCTPPSPPPPPE